MVETTGWENQVVDTNKYTVLCFNIPGNGYDNFLIEDYEDFTPSDIANIFLKGLEALHIKNLYAIIGGSLGGGIGWEMLAKQPKLAEIFIPIACDYRTHDWLHAQCLVQKFLLNQRMNHYKKREFMPCCVTELQNRSMTDFKINTIRKNSAWNQKTGLFIMEMLKRKI
jgi:hypothetical protein